MVHISRIVGCALLLAHAVHVHAQQTPTWSGKVASIIYNNCTSCHRTGEIAPFPLESYDDAAQRASLIAAVTKSGYIPPWKPAHEYGEFLGERSMALEDISTLEAWANAGAPPGDLAAAPAAPHFPSGSQLGTPDMVLEMAESWTVQGNMKDVYRYFVLPTGLLENRSVKALEFRPGNTKVVHHVLFFLDTSGTARAKDAADPGPGYSGFGDPGFESAASYLGWVPGAQMRFYPGTIGARMYKGSDLVIQVHYAPSATEQTDRSHVNVFFQDNPDPRIVQEFTLNPANLESGLFMIPANKTSDFRTAFTIPFDVSIIAVAPHMHLLGTKAKAYAVDPKGDTIPLVKINSWDFHWQGSYAFARPVKVPARSKLYYEASYDNTSNNPVNPNSPPRLVAWGSDTKDEMLLCYFHWLFYQFGDEQLSMETLVSSVDETTQPFASAVSLSPNPASASTTLTFTLDAPRELDVSVADAMGNTVYRAFTQAPYQPGWHQLPLDLSALSNGAYFVVMKGQGAMVSLPLRLMR